MLNATIICLLVLSCYFLLGECAPQDETMIRSRRLPKPSDPTNKGTQKNTKTCPGDCTKCRGIRKCFQCVDDGVNQPQDEGPCGKEGLHCEYGQQCCSESDGGVCECFPNYTCDCMADGMYSCEMTEACMLREPCGDP